LYFSFINIESSTSEDVEEDDYIRDGTDYGNITRIHDDTQEVESGQVTETVYVNTGPDLEQKGEATDLNATIVSNEDVEPSSSIWEGIMGLVEDIDRDSKIVDVSIAKSNNIFLFFSYIFNEISNIKYLFILYFLVWTE
jgi:hypothetical protein